MKAIQIFLIFLMSFLLGNFINLYNFVKLCNFIRDHSEFIWGGVSLMIVHFITLKRSKRYEELVFDSVFCQICLIAFGILIGIATNCFCELIKYINGNVL